MINYGVMWDNFALRPVVIGYDKNDEIKWFSVIVLPNMIGEFDYVVPSFLERKLGEKGNPNGHRNVA